MLAGMKHLLALTAALFWFCHQPHATPASKGSIPRLSGGERDLAEYFRAQTALLAERCLTNFEALVDWEANRSEYRRQLQEMLGLWPEPKRTDLKPVVTGKIQRDDFTVEKLHFQALPHLYVTANLYLPREFNQPLPAILYVCGHARVVTNGVSCGNKTAYQHHGIWFARNGYACLMIDTVQLGEIEGFHHGTYRDGQWWWNSRGYTPAGVEAWFGIRALDYLCSRPEVDKERIGMTGRSGGGAYTWTVAALDERVKVAAPVAGVTDLRNQVVDGAVEGHCDCMFHLNTYRWDFPLMAALVAPRPLLIGNSDKDSIFPLDGVVRLHRKVAGIYRLYNKTENLGLLITEGPHKDTQELQVPVFRWFNRFLKQDTALVEMAARPMLPPLELRVFEQLPPDAVNRTIQETFVPAMLAAAPADLEACRRLLRDKVFAGWPADEVPGRADLLTHTGDRGFRVSVYTVPATVPLSVYVLQDSSVRKPVRVVLNVLDQEDWTNSPARFLWEKREDPEMLAATRGKLRAEKAVYAYFAPTGVDPRCWNADPKKWSHMRRRFMLLGQTLDGMRVWDIRAAVRGLRDVPGFGKVSIMLHAQRNMAVNALYAALFEPGIKVQYTDCLTDPCQGPDYLNVLKYLDTKHLITLLGTQAVVAP
jgi:hypothetical protein